MSRRQEILWHPDGGQSTPVGRDETCSVWTRVVDRAPVGVFRAPNAMLGAVLGAGYLLAGVVAFAIAAGSQMATSSGHHADGLGGLHCALYVLAGLGLLLGVAGGHARTANSAFGAGYLLVGVALLVGAEGAPQLLALHETENLVHLGSAALLLGFGRTQE